MSETSATMPSVSSLPADEKNRAALFHWVNNADTGALIRSRDEPAFVIASWPWKETSLIVELYTKRHGRVGVVARGAKRMGNRFRGLLMPFHPLLVSYSGRNELKNLTDARWLGTLAPAAGEDMVTGFYLNELVYLLTVRENPLPELFDAYMRALTVLAESTKSERMRALREFEVDLLRCCGWGQRIEDQTDLGCCVVRRGELVSLSMCEPEEGETVYSEASVAAVLRRDFTDPELASEVRGLLRSILRNYLGDRELGSRLTLHSWYDFLK